MSSLLELIARRRRASADRRLGPPPAGRAPGLPLNGSAPANGASHTNGTAQTSGTLLANASPNANGNGHAPTGLPALETVDPPALAEDDDQLTVEMAALSDAAIQDEATQDQPGPAPPPVAPRYESWLPSSEWLAPAPPVPAPEPAAAPEPEPATAREPEPVTAPEPTSDPQPESIAPGLIARGRMRRRARYLRHLREIQLRDLGGFTLELHRHDRERPDLVRAKIESAAETDRELRILERALDGRVALRELREPGIGGVCSTCGAVHGSQDRFCASCGEGLGSSHPPDPTPPAPQR